MKLLASLFLLLVFTASKAAVAKDPVVIEVTTKYTKMEEALNAAKNSLLTNKFIAAEIGKNGFTATRTTGAKADYFVADVEGSEENGKIKIKISFVKVGTGLLNLKKVAEEVRKELEA